MELIVGTESTWSLRAWICLQLVNLEVSEQVIDLASASYKSAILKYSPTGLVPALIDVTCVIHDSLARSLCSEMHSGFMNLRNQLPFTLQPITNKVKLSENIETELNRVKAIFESARIPYMFESAGAVDAFYSILAFRLKSYGITFEGKAGEYQQSLLSWSLLKNAITQAKQWGSTYK